MLGQLVDGMLDGAECLLLLNADGRLGLVAACVPSFESHCCRVGERGLSTPSLSTPVRRAYLT